MLAFSSLLDRLSFEPRRSAKEAMLCDYLRRSADPDRGYALAALTGDLTFKNAKPALLRALIADRTDPRLFELSYDFVGDLSETIALLWPAAKGSGDSVSAPGLAEVVTKLELTGKSELPGVIAGWLDALDETERWALLKLVTGGLRVGVSARLAKTAVARLGDLEPNQIEEVWHGLKPPFESLFAWVEGRAGPPDTSDPAPFRPVMLAHPLDEEKDPEILNADEFFAEWKWDGIRIQAASGVDKAGNRVSRLYSRTGEDISRAFPDVVDLLDFDATLDGELLIVSDGKVRPFSDLQRRLNRKTAGPKLIAEYPAAVRVYDLLSLEGEDLRPLPFLERRGKLESFLRSLDNPKLDLSPEIHVSNWADYAQARKAPAEFLPGSDASAVEGLMLKRRDAPYVPGRPKGQWFKWKREPFLVDAVLMYAQRGHGKRSSFYSDYTFGVWRADAGEDVLVPVGKAYFGFTDEELREIDCFVRNNTINRFGPVCEVTHDPEAGLVLEVAFEGLNRSTRHKSGLAMRFPRISRLRWDKKPADADRIATLETLLTATQA
ncbi:cisplatin damage response ATP-dependent DNA ligase [Roseibium polysiphoniae]|uniref:DNA ligase (ATP) n=1 Tax=Roseibium polysiphoniae TaxID=2571221 RepID=A0ABR9CD22_9HYPH|nr:cisplatin damage response ATP-dependent DNA ligase [Roseibium polysiphoniae]MBD8877810.1 cisplatin damage response ATP-dependent DNA ligase [Roseibium polysiphoniae]